ncbi:xylulokinase [Frondihabitans australicus]|uniref:Xylulokinase n=1 Tax=Frondihabitans australicus TaxID=386892 RepID=A0A495IKD2_9MICO|nr:FGGY family carbohydrate kinase [Frondihabitans australicus]RKR76424.1 xylulokinase [Frondihabitans australicus]
MSPIVLGVDASTTGVKAVAFDADGTAVASSRAPLDRRSPHPGWGEQSSDDWWDALRSTARDVMGQLNAAGAGVPVAISIAHQRETFVCLDAEGREIRPAMLWLDTRAGGQIEAYGTDEVHALSGKPPSTTPSLYKMIWLRENEPDTIARTAMAVDVHGYLVWRLTGEFVTSAASADPMSLVDMSTFEWSDELVAMTGLSTAQLPALAAPGSVIGRVSDAVAVETGLPAGLPVVAGAGDGQSAGLGAGVLSADRAYLSLGTSLTLGVHGDAYRTSRSYRTLSSPRAGSYTFEGLIASGALSLAWLRDAITGLPDTAEGNEALSRMAHEVPPGAHGLLFLPYLTSAETPYWDAHARAAFVGLGDYHGAAEMARATFEGLALETRLLLGLIEADTGASPTHLIAMGGASRSETLVQIFADVLQREIDLASEVETVALGAGVLAAAAVNLDGQSDLGDIANRMTHSTKTFVPDASARGSYDDLFDVYRSLYPSLKDAFASLARFRDDD